MNEYERGSEVVQAAVVLPLVLLVVFAVVQVGGMMLSTHRLAADLVRVSRQMDIGGLVLAGDKEAYLKSQLLGPRSQLQSECLRVENVELKLEQKGQGAQPSKAEKVLGSDSSSSSIEQRMQMVKVSFDIAYDLPSMVVIPGLSGQTIMRHLDCTSVESRVVEVGMDRL
ncbi:MAG: TadE/TadG family type IV pilus assembly protein [Gordonibacter sp.]|nr:TadE/TadG family type IV pilus assembly protein [Gordonibacter sp.]